MAAETARHAVRIVLALEAWKLRHGSLPKTLEKLVGPYLAELPVDPHWSQPFRYFRDGLKIAIDWRQPTMYASGMDFCHGTVPADMPFIWTTGANVGWRRVESPWPHTLLDEYRVRATDIFRPVPELWYDPRSEFDIWEAGWPFPIP